jgi:hypothetical protein
MSPKVEAEFGRTLVEDMRAEQRDYNTALEQWTRQLLQWKGYTGPPMRKLWYRRACNSVCYHLYTLKWRVHDVLFRDCCTCGRG